MNGLGVVKRAGVGGELVGLLGSFSGQNMLAWWRPRRETKGVLGTCGCGKSW